MKNKLHILDALIPGRFFDRMNLSESASAQRVLSKPHGWKFVRAIVIGFFIFWYTLFTLAGDFGGLTFIFFGWITPYAPYSIIGIVLLVSAFPGSYYLYFIQARSLKWLTHYLLVEQPDTDVPVNTLKWLAFWRSWFLPGRDIGQANNRSIGTAFGVSQRTLIAAPLLICAVPHLLQMLVLQGAPDNQISEAFYAIKHFLRDYLPIKAMSILIVIGIAMFCAGTVTSRARLSELMNMPPGERRRASL